MGFLLGDVSALENASGSAKSCASRERVRAGRQSITSDGSPRARSRRIVRGPTCSWVSVPKQPQSSDSPRGPGLCLGDQEHHHQCAADARSDPREQAGREVEADEQLDERERVGEGCFEGVWEEFVLVDLRVEMRQVDQLGCSC